MTIKACPFCGMTTTIPEVLAGHTRQECEAKIRARIAHYEQCIALELECLNALHSATNRDAQVPA